MTDRNESKVCRICQKEKKVHQFSKNKHLKTGYDTICAECNRIKAAKYRRMNPEKIRKYKKDWEKRNPNRRKGRKRNATKDTARRKVNRAVHSGKMPHPNTLDYDF